MLFGELKMEMVIFLMAVAGCASLIKAVAPDMKPFSCPLCMGFWIAFIFMILDEYVFNEFGSQLMMLSFAGSYAAWALYSIGEGLED